MQEEPFDAILLSHHPDGWLVVTPKGHGWLFADHETAQTEALELAAISDLPLCEQLQ